jgi:2-polyprenyl-3-methyl-5-hydroxy-6-metoxy-1,4-benzoquinol methylase
MINSSRLLEAFLQQSRFKKVRPYLNGDVLDFGGNKGELRKFVEGSYTLVNYDHSPMENKTFDTVVALAVIEHIEVNDVYTIFKEFGIKVKPNGKILLTTPTPFAKQLLEFLAYLNVLDRHNIEEHKHYWTRDEIGKLANENGFSVKKYKKFQLGFNQLVILEKISNK